MDRSGEIAAQGLIALGQTVADIEEGMRRREDRFSYANAKSTLLIADSEAQRSFEDDDDWATFEERYREKMAAGLEAATKKIKSKTDRKLFELDSKLAIERGAMAIRNAARKKEIDEVRADLDVIVDSALKNTLESPDASYELLDNARDAIAAAASKGVISKEVAGDKSRALSRDYAEAALTIMEPEARLEMLKHPEGTDADFLHKDTRIKMLRAAEKENKATRVKAASQSAVDEIMEKNPEDRGKALASARKIKDPDVRAAAVTSVNARFNEMEAIERENVDRIYDEATEFIGETGSLAGYDGNLQKLTPAQQKSLDDFARYEQKGIEPVHSDEKYEEWLALPIRDVAKVNLLAEYRPVFDDAHFAQAQARQLSIRDGKTEQVQSYVGDVRRIESVLIGTPNFERKPGSGTKDRDRKIRWDRLVGGILRRFEEVAAENEGKPLTPVQKDEIIIKELARRMWVDVRGFDKQFIVAGMSREELAEVYVPYNEIPEQPRRRLENYAKSNNWATTEEQIEKAYGAGVNRLGNDRIDEILSGR